MTWRVEGFTELRELGRGGQGRVVLARHDTAGTPVAIKYLDRRAGDRRELERLRGEAVMLGRVTDPHVVRLYRFVMNDSGAALVMEAVNGVSLREILREHGALEPEAALTVLKGSLLGLAAAHGVGVVHRDYKPANVVVQPDGLSKLIDFGIAAAAGDGAAGGTPAYMAPEQWQGEPATPATDVYAATCVFFECVTGRRPYLGDGIAAQHREAPIPVEDVPEGLRELLVHGMAKAPDERPPGAAAFLNELETAANAAYGSGWEARGVRALAVAAVALASLLPLGAAMLGSGAAVAGGAAAGGAAGGAAGAGLLATTGAKVAVAVITASAVAAGGAGVYVANDGPPSATTTPLTFRPVSETRTLTSPSITYTLRFPQVGGVRDEALRTRINRLLRAPVDQWMTSAHSDIRAFGGTDGSQRPSATYETGLSGPRLMSVRYNFADTQRNSGYPIVTTVDLATGRELKGRDLFRPEVMSLAGTKALIRRLMRNGLANTQGCEGENGAPESRWMISPERLTGDGVFSLLLTRRQAEIGAPMFMLGYSMACNRSAPFAKLPYTELRNVLRPEILRHVGA
ncbi:serine/threonine-protein kinase [Actinomadura fulvescens]|uniref:non-specific serine/threonine protein kinase n=1 Tax=Actinomadura fulvescens TaxID=46160 RepID=A0ABN3PU71_9ACTN